MKPHPFETGYPLRGGEHDYIIDCPKESPSSEAQSYSAHVSLQDGTRGEKVFLKVYAVPENIFDKDTEEKMGRLFRKMHGALMNKSRFDELSNVAKVLDVFLLRSFPVPVIVQQFVEGKPLDEFLENNYASTATGKFSGLQHQNLWFKWARKLVELLGRVHNRSIVHGDIWLQNILIQGDKENPDPWLVDFGQAFLVDRHFFSNPDSSDPSRLRPHWAPERRSLKWYFPADIYQLGGILFYLATGAPPPIVAPGESGERHLKSYIQEKMIAVNGRLFEENPCIAKIIDKCLRHDPTHRFHHSESILDALDIFDYGNRSPSDFKVDDVLKEISINTRKLGEGPTLFSSIVQSELRKLNREIHQMLENHHEIVGEREELINNLLRYLAELQRGDEYLTVTVPAYWSSDNLGTNGRFLMMNVLMAVREIKIRRVFLLSPKDRMDDANDKVRETVEAHIRAEEMARKINPAADFQTLFCLESEEEIISRVQNGEHVAIWRRNEDGGNRVLSIGFTTSRASESEVGRISKIRFWAATNQDAIIRDMERHVALATPIAKFFVQPNDLPF